MRRHAETPMDDLDETELEDLAEMGLDPSFADSSDADSSDADASADSGLALVGAPASKAAAAPGYYSCVAPVEGLHGHGAYEPGDLVYVTGASADYVALAGGDYGDQIAAADFAKSFEFAPDGAALRAAQMARLMAEVAQAQAGAQAQADLIAAFRPAISDGGQVTGMALALGGPSATDAKRALATVRNQAAAVKGGLLAKQKEMAAILAEQSLILRQQTDALGAVLRQAEEAVWTINLYLGQGEEIVPLREGERAPAGTPITVRQLVLYMDEECAVAADEGGIDARDLDAFDKWLTSDSAHLAQVFPEPKGMVALKPRREKRDYGDPFVSAAMNAENRKTYLLVRNGECLWRIWTSYETGEHLIPRTDEFLRLFERREYNRETLREEVVKLKPGSEAFMAAEKRASSVKRHYMRAALILQGLIDRTDILAPLPGPINVGDQAAWEHDLAVVLDGDAMLSDGHERFADWLARVNRRIGVGSRVVGAFDSSEGLRIHRHEKSDYNPRVVPHSASLPGGKTIYTIEERRGDQFAFFYKRAGYTNRATALVERTDRFLVNFDAATVDEMEWFLASRLDRRSYEFMFPTLRLAIRMKAAEEKAEAPFQDLLAGQIAASAGVGLETAAAAVPELVRWWKFKNQTHRALSADDVKALRMIVEEYGRRAEQAQVRREVEAQADAVVATILSAEPDALLIAHKADSDYAVLVPANDEDVFVHEQTWSRGRMRKNAPWRLVDSRRERWQEIYASARWALWRKDASLAENLSDPDREAVAAAVWRWAEGYIGWSTRYDGKAERRCFRPLRVVVTAEGKLRCFWQTLAPKIPAANLITDWPEEPLIECIDASWHRGAGRAAVLDPEQHTPSRYTFSGGRDVARGAQPGMPWEHTGWAGGGKGPARVEPKVFWTDDAAIEDARAQIREVADAFRRRDVLEARQVAARQAFEAAYAAREVAKARARYDADFGDPAAWEEHLKSLDLHPNLPWDSLHGAVGRLVEHGVDPTAMTIGEIADADAALPEALLMGVFAQRKTPPPEDLRDLRALPPKGDEER